MYRAWHFIDRPPPSFSLSNRERAVSEEMLSCNVVRRGTHHREAGVVEDFCRSRSECHFEPVDVGIEHGGRRKGVRWSTSLGAGVLTRFVPNTQQSVDRQILGYERPTNVESRWTHLTYVLLFRCRCRKPIRQLRGERKGGRESLFLPAPPDFPAPSCQKFSQLFHDPFRPFAHPQLREGSSLPLPRH